MNTDLHAPESSSVHMLSLSTNAAPPRERVDYWRETVCDKIVPLNFKVPNESTFEASIKWAKVGNLHIADIHASPHSVERDQATISKSGSDYLIFNFILSGSSHTFQDGKHVHLSPGSGTFCNAARPYSLNFREDIHLLVLQLPRDSIAGNINGIDRVASNDIAQSSQLFPLVMGYVAQLMTRKSALDDKTALRVCNNLTDLVGAMITESVQQIQSPLSESKTSALLRVRAFVEANLSDSELTPAKVSEALRLSPRYINQLLSAEGTSLGRLIWRRRVELIADDLKNPALRARSISTIALARGFNNLAHFSKSFRQAFSASPREYRADVSIF